MSQDMDGPWWRERADDIELQVGAGLMDAMSCYTQMRQLLCGTRRAALEAKQAGLDTSGIVSDDELDNAFSGTNFGTEDHRGLLHQAVLKKSLNYHCGHTITEIMRELGLIRKSGEPTSKGIDMLRVAYRDLTTKGP